MSNKSFNTLVLAVFAQANPKKADALKAGSIKNIEHLADATQYGGEIDAADGTALIPTASWDVGTLAGLLALDTELVIPEQDEAGSVTGLFKKADGSLYLVLHDSAVAADVFAAIGYDLDEDDVSIDVADGVVKFSSAYFTQDVPAVFLEEPLVTHVSLP